MESSNRKNSKRDLSVPIAADKKELNIRRYMKPFIIYGVTIFSNAALSFATFALLTHHLTEIDYGIINLYNAFIILLMPFVAIGIPFVLNVDYFKMDKSEYRKQFANATFLSLVASILFTLLLIVFQSFVVQITKANFFFVVIAAFSCFLIVLNELVLNFIRNSEKYLLFAGFSLGKNIVEVSLTILFVIGLNYNWTGRLGSNFLTLVITGVVILLLIRKWELFILKLNKKLIRNILVTGLPFIPERLALFTMGYSDRFFIDYYSGTADVGYYGAGAQLAMIVNLSILTLNNTFYPKLFKSLSNHRFERSEARKLILIYLAISAIITLCVIAIVPLFFNYFIGSKFQAGKIYAIYLTIGFFFWSIYNVFVAFLLNLRKHNLIMKISVFGMIASIVANFINVKRFGALGATYTNMFVYLMMALVTIYFVHKYYNFKGVIN